MVIFSVFDSNPPTIVLGNFKLKADFFENFSTVFYKGFCKGRLGNTLFFMSKNGEFCSIVLCVSVTLDSLNSYIKSNT